MSQFETMVTHEDWWPELPQAHLVKPVKEAKAGQISHVVDRYYGYPGETITFHTRLDVQEVLINPTLRIFLPEGLTLEGYQAPAEQTSLLPETEVVAGGLMVVWTLEQHLSPGERYEYQTKAKIGPTLFDLTLESQAMVMVNPPEVLAGETVTVAVQSKGHYLRYLPSLYEQDELMGRFLMLFESFWRPIDNQIDNVHYYFDPRITPVDFLPWLASWLDLTLDDRWPEARQRQLIRWAIALHRSRGTKWGLLKYLEIYTGQQAEIVERRAKNFILGQEARLGPGIALGQGNRPHTFTVKLRLPPLEAATEPERQRLEQIRRHTIESIIDMQKPAHTIYSLDLEIIDSDQAKGRLVGPPIQANGRNQLDEITPQATIWFKLED